MLARHDDSVPLTFLRVERGHLLNKIYELRYQVYCLSRGFLPPERYPSGLETDEFDGHAMHFAALDRNGVVVGTARVVLNSKLGFPLGRYLGEPVDLNFRGVPHRRLGEVSRLAVRAVHKGTRFGNALQANRRPEIALGLYKEIYQASRKAGLSHLIAAMERPLGRLLARYSFPFHPVGPEIDYYGPVRPYLLDIAQGEKALHERCPRMFEKFADGLPDRLAPAWFSSARLLGLSNKDNRKETRVHTVALNADA